MLGFFVKDRHGHVVGSVILARRQVAIPKAKAKAYGLETYPLYLRLVDTRWLKWDAYKELPEKPNAP